MEAKFKNVYLLRSAATVLFLLMLSNACLSQSNTGSSNHQTPGNPNRADSIARSKLLTASPRLGGITVTNIVAPVKADGHTFTLQTPIVDIGIPVYKKFKTAHPILLKAGVRYQGLMLSNEKKISGNSFHSITIPLVLSYSVSRATNITLIGSASFNSDYKRDMEAEDIFYTAAARFGFRQNKSLKYGVTLTYIHNYSGSYLLPLPDIDWTITKKLSLTGVVPARLSLKYKLSETQSVGVTIGINAILYRLNEGDKEQYLHLRQNNAGLIYDLKLGQRWKLNLIAGHTLTQKLETFNMDQKVPFGRIDKLGDRAHNIAYSQNSFVFQGGISYQF